MPPALVDPLVVAALLGMLVVAVRHPTGAVEATVAVAATGVVLGAGALPWPRAVEQLRLLLPVVAFLCAILVVAELCAAEGVFAAVGGHVARAAAGQPGRLLGLAFLAAGAVTAVLSLDATVVLLTPVLLAAAAPTLARPRPVALTCVRLANSASLLLPVSNLTNLLAMPRLHLTFARFGLLMAPVWLVVLAVEYVGLRWYFREDLGPPQARAPRAVPPPLPRTPVVVLVLMLAGFTVASPLGVAPAWVAGAAALFLAARAVRGRRASWGTVWHAAHLGFAVFVLGLGVVVAALGDGVLGRVLRDVVPSQDSLPALLLVAAVATVLANLVNNLPATLLLVPVVAPAGTLAVLAALVGLNVGSNLTYLGSLANLLWRRTLVRRGYPDQTRTFHTLSGLVTAPAVVAGVTVLWAGGTLLRP